MSRPWNPHALTLHGEPIPGQVPARLVVHGQASNEVMALVNQRFGVFCGQARNSAALVQESRGRLPDGSTYKFQMVQGQPSAHVWPKDGIKQETDKLSLVAWPVMLDLSFAPIFDREVIDLRKGQVQRDWTNQAAGVDEALGEAQYTLDTETNSLTLGGFSLSGSLVYALWPLEEGQALATRFSYSAVNLFITLASDLIVLGMTNDPAPHRYTFEIETVRNTGAGYDIRLHTTKSEGGSYGRYGEVYAKGSRFSMFWRYESITTNGQPPPSIAIASGFDDRGYGIGGILYTWGDEESRNKALAQAAASAEAVRPLWDAFEAQVKLHTRTIRDARIQGRNQQIAALHAWLGNWAASPYLSGLVLAFPWKVRALPEGYTPSFFAQGTASVSPIVEVYGPAGSELEDVVVQSGAALTLSNAAEHKDLNYAPPNHDEAKSGGSYPATQTKRGYQFASAQMPFGSLASGNVALSYRYEGGGEPVQAKPVMNFTQAAWYEALSQAQLSEQTTGGHICVPKQLGEGAELFVVHFTYEMYDPGVQKNFWTQAGTSLNDFDSIWLKDEGHAYDDNVNWADDPSYTAEQASVHMAGRALKIQRSTWTGTGWTTPETVKTLSRTFAMSERNVRYPPMVAVLHNVPKEAWPTKQAGSLNGNAFVYSNHAWPELGPEGVAQVWNGTNITQVGGLLRFASNAVRVYLREEAQRQAESNQ